MITVRRAEIKDIPMIMRFLNDHWLEGYALAESREFFEWQFVRHGKVNVWLGIDDEERKMYAMEGAIIYNNSSTPDFAGCLWIAVKSDVPMLGLKLSEQMIKELNIRAGFALGLTEDAVRIQRRLHKPVFEMDHYYRLNDLSEYHVAKVAKKEISKVWDSGYRLERIPSAEELKDTLTEEMLTEYSPHKDYEYVEWRYLKHPIFKYDLWGIKNSRNETKAMLVTRMEEANGGRIAKIVDFYGDNSEIANIGAAIDKLMTSEKYEYVDVYSYGVDVKEYEKAGFSKCDELSENIIPNLFQPYVCMNTSLYMIQPLAERSRLFRGDADQDKPRFLKET